MSPLELSANVFNLLSVWFSSRNNVHTWWSGIVGCALYAVLFTQVRLYADVTLQVFFIGSCVVGWWNWQRGGARRRAEASSGAVVDAGSSDDQALRTRAAGTASVAASAELPITHIGLAAAAGLGALAIAAAGAYGSLLHALTDAANPFVDSTVLALSILAQLLMVARKIETWPVWFVVDCIAVPLYGSKGLWLTAAVYAFFLALVVAGWVRWSKLIGHEGTDAT